MKEILEERMGDAVEGEWGLDELEVMEEDSEDDDGDGGDDGKGAEDGDEEEEGKKRETVLRDADEEDNQKVASKKDEVDQLADVLGKTGLLLAWHHPPDPIGPSVPTVYLVLISHIVNP